MRSELFSLSLSSLYSPLINKKKPLECFKNRLKLPDIYSVFIFLSFSPLKTNGIFEKKENFPFFNLQVMYYFLKIIRIRLIIELN